jgi:heme/copper-type cytochrome/quinol oxidase subunit 3
MSARRHELGDLLEGRRSSAVWGAAAGSGVLAILLAYFLYAHLYLAVTADTWPPEGSPDLPLLAPAGVVALAVLAAAVALRAGRPLPPRDDQLPLAAMLGTGAVIGAGAIGAGALLLADLGLAGTERAHDASVLMLHAIAGLAALAGILVNALAAYEAARLGNHPWVASAAAVAAVWWTTVALAWAAVAAVVYGWPALLEGWT